MTFRPNPTPCLYQDPSGLKVDKRNDYLYFLVGDCVYGVWADNVISNVQGLGFVGNFTLIEDCTSLMETPVLQCMRELEDQAISQILTFASVLRTPQHTYYRRDHELY